MQQLISASGGGKLSVFERAAAGRRRGGHRATKKEGEGNEKGLLLSSLVTAASKEGERAWLSIPSQMARALCLHSALGSEQQC